MSEWHTRLFELMADGQFHSGQQLATDLAVSRTAVWKFLQQCRDYGVEIESRHGLGYRLTQAINLLDKQQILDAMSRTARRDCQSITILQKIDSTNDYLGKKIKQHDIKGEVVLAEYQTNGRGRRGNRWISPFASGIFLSLAWRMEIPNANIGLLSLFTGVAVIRCLHSLGIPQAGLKWPNDIILQDKKLAGVLIDLHGEANGPINIIIGVGMNYQLSPSGENLIDQPVTGIQEHLGKNVSRNDIAAKLISVLFTMLDDFSKEREKTLLDEWRKYDTCRGRAVTLYQADKKVSGYMQGINEQGHVLIEANNSVTSYASGEVSLRAN